jgi:hypothetical protein
VYQGLLVGEGGVWRAIGGPKLYASDDVHGSRFCGGALWDVDGPRGFSRLDLGTGEVTHPMGEHGTSFACVDDRWLLDEHGHGFGLDGEMRELLDVSTTIVGTTSDAALIYRYGGLVERLEADGTLTAVVAVTEPPQAVVPIGSDFYVLESSGDAVWRFGPDWRVSGGPYHAWDGGLDRQRGEASVFPWQGAVWAFDERRVYPLSEAPGPLDTTWERFFFDATSLWICHGSVCEARALDALDGPARVVRLPHPFTDDDALSPSNRFLAQSGVNALFRVDLGTGDVSAAAIDGWPDGVSVDDAGRIRWIVHDDEDGDDVWQSVLYEQRGGSAERLDRWSGGDLLSPGVGIRAMDLEVVRWSDGQKSEVRDADGAVEGTGGVVYGALPYGAGLVAATGPGSERARIPGPVQGMGRWADGVWVGRDQVVRFLDADLREVSRLEIPWPLGDFVVDGAASPDGAWFAARRPDLSLAVWKVGPARAVPSVPVAEAMESWVPPFRVGDQLGAPILRVPEAGLLGYSGDSEVDLVFTMLAVAALPDPLERLARRAAVARERPWDDGLNELRRRWLADPTEAAVVADLRALARRAGILREVEGFVPEPAAPGPAFGLAECPSAIGPTRTATADGDALVVVRIAPEGGASWVATVAGADADDARACWQSLATGWPATPACALGACARPPAE